jgi:PAS domain S-box-containing protein
MENLGQENLYKLIFDQTFHFIGVLEPDGTLMDANEAALSFGGLTREDVVGKPFWEAYWWQLSSETQAQLRDAIARAADGEFVRFEVEVQGVDRTAVIDFSLRPVSNEHGEIILIVPEGRDITELKEREQQLQRVNRLNTVIRAIVQTVARAETREEVAQAVCDTLIEFDAYQSTVMGELSPPFDDFEPWTMAGSMETYLDGILEQQSPPLSEGPAAHAVRTGELHVQNDLADLPYDYWQHLAETHGIQSYASVPLSRQGTVYGVLGVYADRSEAFDQEKQRILTELGEIIGYALYTLERREVLDPTAELEFRSAEISQLCRTETDADFELALDSTVSLSDGRERHFWTVNGLSPRIVRRLVESGFPSVSDFRLLKDVEESARFHVTATDQSIAAIFDSFDGELQTVTIKDDTATVTGRFPETVDSTTVTQTIREQYSDIELVAQRRLMTPTYLRQFVEERLTDRQQAVLRLAYFGGYYERPRLKTGDELAAELGISRQTFHYHLRRAESIVFNQLFEQAGAPPSD